VIAAVLAAAGDAAHIPILHAIVLGITQGLSEFLPISSSGHLILVPWLFGWDELTRHPDLNKTFDVALHMGTFVGALVYFRSDIVRLASAALRSLRHRAVTDDDERMAWLLVLSALPGALVGALLEGSIEDHLGEEWLIAIMLIVFGVVLLWADRLPGRRPVEDFQLRDAVVMGVAQACALSPGVSRSGITITAGRWLGLGRDSAARISFLMSLPIIGGAGLYKGVQLAGDGMPPGTAAAFTWGIVASGITGFLAVWGLLKLMRTRTFAPFVAYRVMLGITVLAILASGWR
jgi:undecaprenyl-diphosphatase